jgi:beta-phosphoglucomutase-like phosphatase (HAD superfamily)
MRGSFDTVLSGLDGVLTSTTVVHARGIDAREGAAGIGGPFNVTVDGGDVERFSQREKPAPDGFLRVTARPGVAAARAVVVERCPRRGAAGWAGGFGLVIGDTRNVGRAELRLAGADIVADDVGELVP